MPLDDGNFKPKKNEPENFEGRWIYVCAGGNVRLETRHFRQTFAPEEFVRLLRKILKKQKYEQEKML